MAMIIAPGYIPGRQLQHAELDGLSGRGEKVNGFSFVHGAVGRTEHQYLAFVLGNNFVCEGAVFLGE